jgi:hypothetical protein
MNLFDASLQFPTVIFTLGLSVALLYWLFVMIGALDIDLFHGNADFEVAAAGKGVGEALAGGAKGGAEALKGAHADAHADAGDGFWATLGLGKVPITIALSVVFLVCWALSLLAMHYAPDVVGTGSWVAPTVLPATLLVGLPLSGLLVRPLGGLFEVHEGKSNRDYIGHTCTITTGHVDDNFGQATIEDGGSVLVVAVRCDRPGVLARDDKALIIDFDTARHAYLVEPAADMLPGARELEPGETA